MTNKRTLYLNEDGSAYYEVWCEECHEIHIEEAPRSEWKEV
jgi:cytochrome c5